MKTCILRIRREEDKFGKIVIRLLKNDQNEKDLGVGTWIFPCNMEVGQEISPTYVWEDDLLTSGYTLDGNTAKVIKERPAVGAISLIYHKDGIISIKCEKGRGLILPGGKWEVGETIKETAKRELLEETGLVASSQELVFHAFNTDGFYVYAFLTRVADLSVFQDNVRVSTWTELFTSNFKPYYELLRDVMNDRCGGWDGVI